MSKLAIKLKADIAFEEAVDKYVHAQTDNERMAESMWFAIETTCDKWIDENGYITVDVDLDSKHAEVREV